MESSPIEYDSPLYLKYQWSTYILMTFVFVKYGYTYLFYVAGIFINIAINYLLKIIIQYPLPNQTRDMIRDALKHRFPGYYLYGLPCSQIQNLAYSLGFISGFIIKNKSRILTLVACLIIVFIIALPFSFIQKLSGGVGIFIGYTIFYASSVFHEAR